MKKMNYIIATSAVFLLSVNAISQFTHNWSFSVGSTSTQDYNETKVQHAADDNGNIFITTSYPDVIDFDPSAAVANLTSNGGQQTFIAKYDNAGNYLWAKNIPETPGSNFAASSMHITSDHIGNVVLVGPFNVITDFDPSGGTTYLTPTGTNTDSYIAKYDPSGNLLWAKHLEGSGYAQINYITTDSTNNLYVTGGVNGTIDLDPSASTANFSGAGTYFSKYSPVGDYIWGGMIDSLHGEISLVTDENSVYYQGRIYNNIDADFGIGTYMLQGEGNYNHLILKYSQDGDFDWAFQLGGAGEEKDAYLAVDDANIYLVADFEGTILNFNLVDSSNYLASINGASNIFLASYNKDNLSFNWVKRVVSTPNNANVFGIGQDYGGIQVIGDFRTEADFDPTSTTYTLNSQNSSGSIYVAKYSKTAGQLLWAVGSKYYQSVNSYSYDFISKTAVTCGIFLDTVDVNFESVNSFLYAGNSHDMYLATYTDVTTGLQTQPISEMGIQIYPNPASSQVNIELFGYSNAQYMLFNTMGQLILNQRIHKSTKLDISTIPSGMYYLRVADDINSITKSLIISKQ